MTHDLERPYRAAKSTWVRPSTTTAVTDEEGYGGVFVGSADVVEASPVANVPLPLLCQNFRPTREGLQAIATVVA